MSGTVSTYTWHRGKQKNYTIQLENKHFPHPAWKSIQSNPIHPSNPLIAPRCYIHLRWRFFTHYKCISWYFYRMNISLRVKSIFWFPAALWRLICIYWPPDFQEKPDPPWNLTWCYAYKSSPWNIWTIYSKIYTCKAFNHRPFLQKQISRTLIESSLCQHSTYNVLLASTLVADTIVLQQL